MTEWVCYLQIMKDDGDPFFCLFSQRVFLSFSFLFFCPIIMYCHVNFVIWPSVFNDFYCCFINPGLFMESTPFLIFCGIIYQHQFRAGDHLRFSLGIISSPGINCGPGSCAGLHRSNISVTLVLSG